MNAVLIKEYRFFFTRQHILVINKSWIFLNLIIIVFHEMHLLHLQKKNK
jgi:hypothetical protein